MRRRSSRSGFLSYEHSSSGGKYLLGLQTFGVAQNPILIPFESEEISPHRTPQPRTGPTPAGSAWRRLHRPQQRFEVGNFVSLLLDRHLLERHPQVVRHSGEELQRLAIAPPAAAQRLAVHGQSGDGRRLLRQHPLADDRHQLAHLAVSEYTAKVRVAGRTPYAVLAWPHAHRRQLALGEGSVDGLEVLEARAPIKVQTFAMVRT